ncbi:MAG: lipoprotein [Gammaproteobacteria bacterium]|nr:lipoprotein [Gammaproteobacteria bacterium]MDH3767133.1 lipoprotein [Gammaproteobacteria bacterium]
MNRFLFAIALTVLLGLGACGQTGDLYWPEDEQVEVDEDETESNKNN